MEQIDSRTIGEYVSIPMYASKLKKSSDEEHTFRNGERRAPLVPQDVKTDAAVGVDVGVVDAGGEVDLWRLEGVVCRKVDR
jgi:hypothetical protein